jgi:hypothetical protein
LFRTAKKLTDSIQYAQAQRERISEQLVEEPAAIYEGGNNRSMEKVA